MTTGVSSLNQCRLFTGCQMLKVINQNKWTVVCNTFWWYKKQFFFSSFFFAGIDADDLMASGKTDAQGMFELKGYTDEITTIDPKLNIYHDCEDGMKVRGISFF